MFRPKAAVSTLALVTSYPRYCIGFRPAVTSLGAGRCLRFGASSQLCSGITKRTYKSSKSSYLTMESEENMKKNNGELFLFDFDGGELKMMFISNERYLTQYSILNFAIITAHLLYYVCSCLR
jgi:hypothetical protein